MRSLPQRYVHDNGNPCGLFHRYIRLARWGRLRVSLLCDVGLGRRQALRGGMHVRVRPPACTRSGARNIFALVSERCLADHATLTRCPDGMVTLRAGDNGLPTVSPPPLPLPLSPRPTPWSRYQWHATPHPAPVAPVIVAEEVDEESLLCAYPLAEKGPQHGGKDDGGDGVGEEDLCTHCPKKEASVTRVATPGVHARGDEDVVVPLCVCDLVGEI